eukprot:TRINITY_DN10476_c0_g1_i13.p1 TRINITY_DN10476_c0_g1~~TRINITY_DN10476_c0_g1_i13.p1  ORF type:complete len:256 (-),score=76.49 TRINITY_DN10476_c0_g1_i13:928-1695(-)
MEAAFDEVEILEQVSTKWKTKEWQESYRQYESAKEISSDSCNCIQLLNSFIQYGPNGKHFVMVFEISGVNLLEVIKRYNYRGIPLPLVRTVTRQMLIGLDYLHRICHIIHTDLKPENVVVCLSKEELRDIVTKGQFGSNKSEYKHGAGALPEAKLLTYSDSKTENTETMSSELTEEQRKERKKQKRREKKKRLKQKKQAAKIQSSEPQEIPKPLLKKRGSNPALFSCLSNTMAAWENGSELEVARPAEPKPVVDR